MEILRIIQEKNQFFPLLLLADEQEDVIEKYLNRGELFALYDPDLRAACVLTDEGEGVFELQNIAVLPEYQRKGYGRALVNHVIAFCRGRGKILLVGTGESPVTLPFYKDCGFTYSHRIKDYMLTHYDHPVIENGVQLFDKVYFSMKL